MNSFEQIFGMGKKQENKNKTLLPLPALLLRNRKRKTPRRIGGRNFMNFIVAHKDLDPFFLYQLVCDANTLIPGS